MKKYLEVANITLKQQIAYRFDIAFGVVLSFLRIILAFILWGILFKDRNEIAGFTYKMMITYYIVMSFLKRLDTTDSIVRQLSVEIREGMFTKYLTRPINPFWFFTFSTYSKSLFIFGINLAATIMYILVFKQYIILHTNFYACLSAIVIFLLGINFLISLNYFIAVLSFKFIDIDAFNMIKNNFMEFLMGALIPLGIMPIWLQAIMKYFPFYYVYYLPARLFMNLGGSEVPMAILVLISWNLAMYFLMNKVYKTLLIRYEGVGL